MLIEKNGPVPGLDVDAYRMADAVDITALAAGMVGEKTFTPLEFTSGEMFGNRPDCRGNCLSVPSSEMMGYAKSIGGSPVSVLSVALSKAVQRVHLNNNTYLNIEVQVRRFQEWTNRTVVYTCRQITEQSNRDGFTYKSLEPVIHVAIMDHTLFEDHKRFFTRYEVMDEEGYRYTDKIQFYVMDLKAIAEASEEERNRGLVEWAEAFRARDWEQLGKINNPGVKEAAKEMEAVMSSPEKRQFVWNRRLAQLDYNSQIDSARDEGKMEGINQIASLMSKLFSLGRTKDAEKAANDPAYLHQLLVEFGLVEA